MNLRVFFGVLAFCMMFASVGLAACTMAAIGDREAKWFGISTAASVLMLATFASLAIPA